MAPLLQICPEPKAGGNAQARRAALHAHPFARDLAVGAIARAETYDVSRPQISVAVPLSAPLGRVGDQLVWGRHPAGLDGHWRIVAGLPVPLQGV